MIELILCIPKPSLLNFFLTKKHTRVEIARYEKNNHANSVLKK